MFEFIKTRGLFQILCGSNADQILDKNTQTYCQRKLWIKPGKNFSKTYGSGNKKDISIILYMGSFTGFNKIKELIKYETSPIKNTI